MVSSSLCPAVHTLGSQNMYSRAEGNADHYWPWAVFESTGRAFEPLGWVSEPAGRVSESSGRALDHLEGFLSPL